MTTFRKETTLEGYYATGDYESFCFDKHKGPQEHDEATHPSEPTEGDTCADEGSPEEAAFYTKHAAWNAWAQSCRVYPSALLPELPKELLDFFGQHKKKGAWKITIEFTPEEDSTP